MMWEKFQSECEKLLKTAGVSAKLEAPREGQADLALPCFSLSREQKRAPQLIAKELEERLSSKKKVLVKEIQASGPYLNFHINHEKFGPLVVKETLKGFRPARKKHRIVVEFPGPNTNKPLHLGHVRNMILGTSVSNILGFLGNDVIRVDIVNDRGVHICKSMLAYEKFGRGESPKKKSDHFVGDYYVLFAKELEGKPGTEEELRNMLVQWEEGNKRVRALWKKMNKWALDGFQETYDRLGVRIDKTYFESEHYQDGKKIVLNGLKSKIFKKDEEGNIIIDLEDLGKRVLLRSDGTSVYITQDLGLAAKRYKELKMDKMIYVVGEEQNDHFRALFMLLKILGYPFSKNLFHLSYGMVNLPEGKMKSREGKVVDADDLMDEMHRLAEKKIGEHGHDVKDKDKTAEKIGLAAIKYFIVKFDPQKSITYDPQASLDFEGDTGPYLQYTYARANSILKKSKKTAKPGPPTELVEMKIATKLSLFLTAVEKSGQEYKPNILANYIFELATLFNEFYHSVQVVNSDKEEERLALVKAVMTVLETGLGLLGINVLKEM